MIFPLRSIVFACFILLSAANCSSPPKTPESEASPVISTEKDKIAAFRERAVHPDGFAISDVRALFIRKDAPSAESLENCDFDYHAEKTIARNREELFMTLPEHIKDEPDKYHWCFYAKILKFEDDFQNKALFVDQRRDLLNKRYLFFVHVARVFLVDFEDSRYLEFANFNYKRLKAELFRSEK